MCLCLPAFFIMAGLFEMITYPVKELRKIIRKRNTTNSGEEQGKYVPVELSQTNNNNNDNTPCKLKKI